MCKRILNSFLALLVLPSLAMTRLGVGYSKPFYSSPVPQAEGVTLESEDGQGVTLNFNLGHFEIQNLLSDDGACQEILFPGSTHLETPGWPGMPVRGTLIGIPVGVEVSLRLLESKTVTLDGKYSLCSSNKPVVEYDDIGGLHYVGEQPFDDPAAVGLNEFWPEPVVELVETGFIRSQRIAQIRIHPFQYNSYTGEVRYFPRLLFQLRFTGAAGSNQPASALDKAYSMGPVFEGAFESILESNLLNYSAAKNWRSAGQLITGAQKSLAMSSPTSLGAQTFEINVSTTGIYQVTYTDLANAGADLSGIDPATFQLYQQWVETPILVEDGGNGSFDVGDRILFYGQRIESLYTRTNAYFLTWGVAQGMRMAEISSEPNGAPGSTNFWSSQRFEQDKYIFTYAPNSLDNDIWYWDAIQATTSPVSRSYNFQVNNVDTAAGLTATISGLLQGLAASPNHLTRIFLNGTQILERSWPKLTTLSFTVDVPQSLLFEGANTLTVELPVGSGITKDVQAVDWFEVQYWKTYAAINDKLVFEGETIGPSYYTVSGFSSPQIQVYDITEPSAPVKLNYSMVSLDTQTASQGNYSLVVQKDAVDQREFIALTEINLLSPDMLTAYSPADLQSTGNGADYIVITHKDFEQALAPLVSWRQSQGFRVKLVELSAIYNEFNGGVEDPQAIHDFLAYAYANWQSPAPMYVVLVGDGNYDPLNNMGYGDTSFLPPYLGWSDPYIGYTALENRYVTVSGTDNYPDMHIGRLPVRTAAETTSLVQKILSYEQNPAQDDWNRNVTFVADNTDSAGNFEGYQNKAALYVTELYNQEKIYYMLTHYTVSEARAAILSAFNQGRLFVDYFGHGANQGWGAELFLENASLNSMTNYGRYPMLLSIGCLTAAFHFANMPGYDLSSLTEALMRADGKGAIASWGSAGIGAGRGQDYLNQGFMNAVFSQGLTRVGAAITEAKYNLITNNGNYPDLVDNYTYLGDPALLLKVYADPNQVVISGFQAVSSQDGNLVSWETGGENNLLGFNVYRSTSPDGIFTILNPELIQAKYLGSGSGGAYLFMDETGIYGETYFYKLEVSKNSGGSDFYGPQSAIFIALLQKLFLPLLVED